FQPKPTIPTGAANEYDCMLPSSGTCALGSKVQIACRGLEFWPTTPWPPYQTSTRLTVWPRCLAASYPPLSPTTQRSSKGTDGRPTAGGFTGVAYVGRPEMTVFFSRTGPMGGGVGRKSS